MTCNNHKWKIYSFIQNEINKTNEMTVFYTVEYWLGL